MCLFVLSDNLVQSSLPYGHSSQAFFWHSQSRWAQAFQDPWPYVGCWVGRLDDTDDSKPLTLKDLQSWTKPRMPWAQRNNSKTSRGVSLCWKVSVRHGGWGCWSVVFSVIHTSWLVSSLASFMTWFWPWLHDIDTLTRSWLKIRFWIIFKCFTMA